MTPLTAGGFLIAGTWRGLGVMTPVGRLEALIKGRMFFVPEPGLGPLQKGRERGAPPAPPPRSLKRREGLKTLFFR